MLLCKAQNQLMKGDRLTAEATEPDEQEDAVFQALAMQFPQAD